MLHNLIQEGKINDKKTIRKTHIRKYKSGKTITVFSHIIGKNKPVQQAPYTRIQATIFMKPLNWILAVVAVHMDCTREQLLGAQRSSPLVRARAVFTHITRKMGYEYTAIARHMNRDHTAILHLDKLWDKKYSLDCRSVVRMIERAIRCRQSKSDILKFYFTNKPCQNGHIAYRYKSTGLCILCERESSNKKYEKKTGKPSSTIRRMIREVAPGVFE